MDDNDAGQGPDTCGQSTDGLDRAQAVAVSPDNASVYAGSRDDDAVVRFDRAAGGALTPQGCIDDNDTGPDDCAQGADGLDDVFGLAVSADGLFLYAAARGDDAIAVFDRSPNPGALTPRGCVDDNDPPQGGDECAQSTDGLNGARSVAVVARWRVDLRRRRVRRGRDHVRARSRRRPRHATRPRRRSRRSRSARPRNARRSSSSPPTSRDRPSSASSTRRISSRATRPRRSRSSARSTSSRCERWTPPATSTRRRQSTAGRSRRKRRRRARAGPRRRRRARRGRRGGTRRRRPRACGRSRRGRAASRASESR